MATDVIPYRFDLSHIRVEIVPVGVGNYHRAHQGFYTNRLPENPTSRIRSFVAWPMGWAPGDEPGFLPLFVNP
ncbi:hypothetical protein [Spirosoma koreense]